MSGGTAAERLLMQLGISKAQDIDLDAIAWHVGAAVKYRRMDSADATIVGSSKHAVIAINSSAIPTRRRFSLAHELGHWHHHRGRVLFCGPADIGNFARGPLDPERQADSLRAKGFLRLPARMHPLCHPFYRVLGSKRCIMSPSRCGFALTRAMMNSLKFVSLASNAASVSFPRNSSCRSQTR